MNSVFCITYGIIDSNKIFALKVVMVMSLTETITVVCSDTHNRRIVYRVPHRTVYKQLMSCLQRGGIPGITRHPALNRLSRYVDWSVSDQNVDRADIVRWARSIQTSEG